VLTNYVDKVIEQNLPAEKRDIAWQALAVLAEHPSNTAAESELISELADYGIPEEDTRQVLHLLATNRLVQEAEAYRLASAQLLSKLALKHGAN